MTTILSPHDSHAARHAMVASQLRTTAVSDQRVVAAMASIAREDFLPAAARDIAYRDTLIPLGEGRYANLPMVTGRLLTEARLEATDRVLLIGAAGGYAAAVLASIVAEVVAVELSPALLNIARAALAGEARVRLVEGPLPSGAADGAPYDVLVVDGAVERLPDALVDQLRPGGRAVAGLVQGGVARLCSGRRTAGFAMQPFADSDCAPLPGFGTPARFQF